MKRLLALLLAILLLAGCFACAAAEAETLTIKKWKKLGELYQKIEDAGVPASVDLSAQTIGIADLTALEQRYPDTSFY